MSEKLNDRHWEEVGKTRTLLQGTSASAIAFAIFQTSARTPEWSLLPIAGAMLCWAVGFAAGIINSHAKQGAIKVNIAMEVLRASDRASEAEELRPNFAQYNDRVITSYQVLMWSLLAGAILYVIGHGMHIAENANRLGAPVSAIEAGPPAAGSNSAAELPSSSGAR